MANHKYPCYNERWSAPIPIMPAGFKSRDDKLEQQKVETRNNMIDRSWRCVMYFQGASLKCFFTFFLNLFLLSTADAQFISKFTSADGKTMHRNYSDCSNR